MLKWLLIIVLVGYCGLLLLVYLGQRALQYFPERARTPPAAAGLPEAEEVVLDASDGERVIVWHIPPRGEKPVVLYFHGNGGSLRFRVDRFRALAADGTGLIALSYRGYGGSSGRPTEKGLIDDAFAAARYPASRLALWGESLGTGVAVALAAQKPVGRIVLESPFTSIADIAAQIYWFFPVRLLIKDSFRSDLLIGTVTAPFLILHGDKDSIVPIALGDELYKLITAPKRFVRFPGAGHNELAAYGALEAAKQFLSEPVQP
jgi:pimeloyl-ACP methyl ester carboxylesterase